VQVLGELLAAAGPLEYFAAATGGLALIGLCLLCRHDRRMQKLAPEAVPVRPDDDVQPEPVSASAMAPEPVPANLSRTPFKTYIPPVEDASQR